MIIRPSGSWTPDRPDATAATRVSAFTSAAGLRHRGRIDYVTLNDGRVYELALADLEGLLGIVADLCPDHQRCGKCGAVSCDTCAIGEPLTDCVLPHCAADVWCWCDACLEAHREDFAAEAMEDGT